MNKKTKKKKPSKKASEKKRVYLVREQKKSGAAVLGITSSKIEALIVCLEASGWTIEEIADIVGAKSLNHGLYFYSDLMRDLRETDIAIVEIKDNYILEVCEFRLNEFKYLSNDSITGFVEGYLKILHD